MASPRHSFHIQDLVISPPLALAPMVGLSHAALRSVMEELGGVGLFFTEMLSAKRLPNESERVSPCLIRSEEKKPLFYQIFLSEPQVIAPAIEKLHGLEASGVDLNLGCPAPKLRKLGAGCALTKDFDKVKAILKTLRQATELPLSVKIRLGTQDRPDRYTELCKIIEGEGADCLVVHARFDHEKFCRKPRWERIGEAKKILSIPVVANGGIFSTQDAVECLLACGADGLMLGRGAVVRPWLFQAVASEVYGIPMEGGPLRFSDIYFQFADTLTSRFPVERRLGRLKQFTHYYAESSLYGHQLACSVQVSSTMEEALERAEAFFFENDYDLIKDEVYA